MNPKPLPERTVLLSSVCSMRNARIPPISRGKLLVAPVDRPCPTEPTAAAKMRKACGLSFRLLFAFTVETVPLRNDGLETSL